MPESEAREVELPRGAVYSIYVLRIRSLCAVTNYQFSGWCDFQSGPMSDLGARTCEVRFTSMSLHR
jgi:hypothetical protein